MEMLFYHSDKLNERGDTRGVPKCNSKLGILLTASFVAETGILYILQFSRSYTEVPKLGLPIAHNDVNGVSLAIITEQILRKIQNERFSLFDNVFRNIKFLKNEFTDTFSLTMKYLIQFWLEIDIFGDMTWFLYFPKL